MKTNTLGNTPCPLLFSQADVYAQGHAGISVPCAQTQGKKLFLGPFANEERAPGVL